MRTTVRWLLVVGAVLATLPAGAATWYVAATGDDANTGDSPSAAFKTIRRGVDAASAGDAVRVAAGIYTECVDASGKAIHLVSEDILAQNPTSAFTIIDGAGSCGGRFCDASPTQLVCVNDASCSGTCEILSGVGRCSNDARVACAKDTCDTTTKLCRTHPQTSCRADADCANLDCRLGGCVPIRVCSTTRSTWCLDDGDCPAGETCQAPAAGPVVTLSDGCSIDGFTVRQGGRSGISAVGSVTIRQNLIVGNMSDDGGGVYVVSSAAAAGTAELLIEDNEIQANIASRDGGGIFLVAEGSEGLRREVTLRDNLIYDNTARGPAARGAGVVVATATSAGGIAKVSLENNRIFINTLAPSSGGPSYGAGMFASTTGQGEETILLSGNAIRGNVSTGDGGGVSAWIQADGAQKPTLILDSNSITANTADGGGGGVDLYARFSAWPDGATAVVEAKDNEIAGNTALGVRGGGGLLATWESRATMAAGAEFRVAGNRIGRNKARVRGCGAALIVDADSTLGGGGGALPTDASMVIDHNIISENFPSDPRPGETTAAGISLALAARGDATASGDLDFNTIAANSAPDGTGGVEIVADTEFDSTGQFEGEASASLTNSIVSGNEGYGVETLSGGTQKTAFEIAYNDVFGNEIRQAPADYGPNVGDRTGENGNVSLDPGLNPGFVPQSPCAGSVDRANPDADFSQEPQPNGSRANLGSTGGTPIAIISLPDINADRVVDGVDLAWVGSAFASTEIGTPSRFSPPADLNKDGAVDGEDLSFVALFFGTTCP